MRPRHFYHCTTDYHGEVFVPARKCPKEMARNEPPTPRLCVCPTIAGCFSARLMIRNRPVYVYKTESRRRGIEPRNVWDAIVTGEKWLIPPVQLIHVATINGLFVTRAIQAIVRYHDVTRKNSSFYLRVCQRAISFKHLGGPDWEGRMLDRWMKRLKIDDPEMYVYRKILKDGGSF